MLDDRSNALCRLPDVPEKRQSLRSGTGLLPVVAEKIDGEVEVRQERRERVVDRVPDAQGDFLEGDRRRWRDFDGFVDLFWGSRSLDEAWARPASSMRLFMVP